MKNKFATLLMIFAFLFTVPSLSLANHGGKCSMSQGMGKCSHGGGCCSHGKSDSHCPIAKKFFKKAHMILNYETELGLSQEQVDTIKNLKIQMKKQMIQDKANMQIGMLDMEAKLKEEKVDVEGLNAMIDQGMAGWAQSAKKTVEAYAQLKSVLSSEQWSKLKELKHGSSTTQHSH